MAVYKDKNGTWYVSARYTNWKGEADRKLKRGFQTKKEATEWERNFFLENAGNLEMTFEAFYELYKKNMNTSMLLLPFLVSPNKNTAIAAAWDAISLSRATPRYTRR